MKVIKIKKPVETKPQKRLFRDVQQLFNKNRNDHNSVINLRNNLLKIQEHFGYKDILTNKSQQDLAEYVMAFQVSRQHTPDGKKYPSVWGKDTNKSMYKPLHKYLKNRIDDKNKNVNEVILARYFLLFSDAYMKGVKVNAEKARQKKMNNNYRERERQYNEKKRIEKEAAVKKRHDDAVKRNIFRNEVLAEFDNANVAKFQKREKTIFELQHELKALRKTRTSMKGKRDRALSSGRSMMQKKQKTHTKFTKKEQVAYDAYGKKHKDLTNEIYILNAKIRMKVQTSSNLSAELQLILINKKIRNNKKKANANIEQKKIKGIAKGIAKGAIQKAIAANKVRVKRAAENAKSVANIAKFQAKIIGYQNDIKKLGNMNTFDKKIKKVQLLDKIRMEKRDQLSEQMAPFERNIRDEFGQKVTAFIGDAIWGQDRFINTLKRRNLNTFDKIKTKFGNTFMNNMDKLATRRKKLVKELNDSPNEIKKLKQEKEADKQKAKNQKFFDNLDAKEVLNMKKQANADMGIKKLDEEIDAIKIDQKKSKTALAKKFREKKVLKAKLIRNYGWDYYSKLEKSKKEEDKLLFDAFNDIYEQWEQMKTDDNLLKERITKAKKERTALKKKRKINPTKSFYLYQISKMLESEGFYSKKLMLQLNDIDRNDLKIEYLDFRKVVDHKYLKIPEFRQRAENKIITHYRGWLPYIEFFTSTLENRERVLASNVLSEDAKGYAVRASDYNISKPGVVKQIMDLKIPPYWKAKLLQKAQVYEEFRNLNDLNLITPNVSNSFKHMKNVIEKHRKRLEHKVAINKAIAKLKPAIMNRKIRQNKKKLNTGVGNAVTNESIARIINKLLTNITKKQENVEKLRKNYANMKHKNTTPKKLKFVQNEINRRNTEIRNMVKEMNKYDKFMKVNKSKRATAASKITSVLKGRLTRKYTNILKSINKSKKQTKKLEQNAQNLLNKRTGNVNKIDNITNRKRLADQKKVIDRFLGKLAQDTRSTVKQKYKILTRLMEPNPEFNFLGDAGGAEDLANALGRRGLVCHLEGKNAKFVKGYLPMLRESLYVLSKQYLDQYDAKNAADKKIFHRTFFNKVVNKAAYPCLEGTFTGMTEAIVEPAFNWTGKYGYAMIEVDNGKEIITKNPYNFNKSKDVEKFVHGLIGLSLGPYYETLSSNMKTKYQNKSKKEQLKFMWDFYQGLQLSHGRGGYLTYMGEIENNEGRKVRQAFVNSFKEYGNYIYENNVNHNKEINALGINNL